MSGVRQGHRLKVGLLRMGYHFDFEPHAMFGGGLVYIECIEIKQCSMRYMLPVPYAPLEMAWFQLYIGNLQAKDNTVGGNLGTYVRLLLNSCHRTSPYHAGTDPSLYPFFMSRHPETPPASYLADNHRGKQTVEYLISLKCLNLTCIPL